MRSSYLKHLDGKGRLFFCSVIRTLIFGMMLLSKALQYRAESSDLVGVEQESREDAVVLTA